MNERIDVLAVMDWIGEEAPFHSDEVAKKFTEVRAAVADLIAGMRQVLIESTESPNSDAMRIEVIEGLARAALARVGCAE